MEAIKKLEERLRESEERFKVLFRFSSDWYWEQDSEFRFTLIALNVSSGVPFTKNESIGKTRWELPYIGVTDAEWDTHKALLRAHQPFKNLILKRYDRHGKFGYSSVSGAPMYDADGNFKGYRGIGKDVTAEIQSGQREAMEHAVTRLLAQSGDFSTAIPNIIQTICETLEWDYGAFWNLDTQGGLLRLNHTWHRPSIDVSEFIARSADQVAKHGDMRNVEYGGVIRRVWLTQEPVWISDVTREPSFARAEAAARNGLRAAFGFPVIADQRALGMMEFYDRECRLVDEPLLKSLQSVGRQIGIFYQRKRAESRQAMEHMITRMLAESETAEIAMPNIVKTICETLGWDYGGYWALDEDEETATCRSIWNIASLNGSDFLSSSSGRRMSLRNLRQGHRYKLWKRAETIWIDDIGQENSRRAQTAALCGLHSVFSFPVLAGQKVIGVIEFFSHNIRQPDQVLVDMAHAIGMQIGQFCQRKQAEERIQFLAYFDGLTGLPNRTLFNQRLQHAIAQAQRQQKNLAVLFVDLDRFKNINDTLGHEAGDHLLKEMSLRFKNCLRESDTVARLGGDEFVILLEDMTDPQYAAHVADKIIGAALDPFTISGADYHVSASIGISTYPHDGQDVQTLMKHADIAMYLAKDHGKNNYQMYSTQINVHSFERLALESSLRSALERNELSLHYQAKAEIATGRITGMEALLRWRHPDLGMISPSLFIPLAEETGLIVPIGRWVIRTACAQNKAWQEQGLPPLRISVNLSARQFNDEHILHDVSQALRETALEPGLLEVEITESMVMHSPDKAVKLLSAMRAMGISIAMDDFGIGYSSLSQLKRLPINTLKIDRSFIKDLMMNNEDAAITGAIIAMAKSLHLNVVAEGVETEDQLLFLKERNCNEMQGYLFSKPLPADECFALLSKHNGLIHGDGISAVFSSSH